MWGTAPMTSRTAPCGQRIRACRRQVCRLACSVVLVGGCASFEPYSMNNTMNIDLDETYFDIINREAKLKAPRRPQRRLLLLYGTASETEQQAGLRVRVPF